MKIIDNIKIYTVKVIVTSIKYLIYILYRNCPKDRILFIPHPSMSKDDGYNITNYRSDNALYLANYILSNNLVTDKSIVIAISNSDNLEDLKSYVNAKFPNVKVEFILNFIEGTKRQNISFYINLMKSSVVFTSITYRLRPFSLSKRTKYIDLGYFPAPFKNDIIPPDSQFYMKVDNYDKRDVDYYVCNSELASRLISTSLSLDHSQYINLGNCRNDYLSSNEYNSEIRNSILSKVSYDVEKIILYTPTHRDYEQYSDDTSIRSVLGYEINPIELNDYLKEHKILIIAKIHSKQNKKAINRELPESILIHEDKSYGLSELMKISDCLLTDYTSTYFDYLLLDKPVIFNFYDIDYYQSTRGFTYDPVESICAGPVVYRLDELLDAFNNIENNKIKYKEKRKIIRDLFFKYQDGNSTKRIFDKFRYLL